MRDLRKHRLFRTVAALLVLTSSLAAGAPFAWGASHREAPLIALDPTADITDVYAFRSWADPTRVVFMLNVIPGQEPSSGPNYFNFDDSVLYAIHLDIDGPADQKRLGPFAHTQGGAPTPDPAGWPNGRRPHDDVTDVALRVVAGVVSADPCCAGFPHNRLGDGVNFNIGAPGAGTADGPGYGSVPGNRLDTTTNGIAEEFPFLATPHDGRNRRHIDCGESPNNRPCN